MSATAVLLVLASAFLHAVWNAMLKRERDIGVAAAAVLAVATVAAGLAVPLSPRAAFPTSEGLAWGFASGFFEAGYFVTLGRALKAAPMGLAYTVSRGGSILIVWPLSVLWMGEAVGPAGLAGAALLCAGLAVMGAESLRGGTAGLGWAVLCAGCIAGYHLCYKRALGFQAEPTALFALSLAIALPPNLLQLGADARRVPRRLRERPLTLCGAGLLCTTAFLVFLSALDRSGAGAVLTLRNTSVVFAQGMAWAIGERPSRRQLAGAALVTVGAVALSWP